jgi:exonuclease VII large subunit
MKRYLNFRIMLRAVLPAAALLAFAMPKGAAAQAANPSPDPSQDHIVSAQALQQQVESSSAQRQQNIDTLQQMLKLPEAQKAMQDAKVTPEQVKQAIPTLSDQELSDLASRTRNAQQQFNAGYIGQGLFLIIILLIILIVVVAVVH